MYLPSPLIQSLQGITGFSETAFIQCHQTATPSVSIRENERKSLPNQHFANTTPVPWCPNSCYLAERPSFTNDPLLHAGNYYVQEASSMFLWQMLTQTIHDNGTLRILDLCAAPGGKTTLLSSYFSNSLVISNEVIAQRVKVLIENTTKWGNDNVIVTQNDASHFKSIPNFFDVVVIDAPCSGSGLFRKQPTAIDEWSIDNVNLCAQRQQRIIADVLPTLKEGGLLIYSTCSYSPEENEAILDYLTQTWKLESIPIKNVKQWGIIETQSPESQAYGYRFYPYLVQGEGFFIAAFHKNINTSNETIFTTTKKNITIPNKQEQECTLENIILPQPYTFFKQNEVIKGIPSQWWNDLQHLSQYLYIKKAGICLGDIKGKDFIPHHELALSTVVKHQFNTLELDKEQALQYLRKKEITINTSTKGWHCITHQHNALGWVKILPNRINNYYPTEYRILKD